jgi:hypothetical protein
MNICICCHTKLLHHLNQSRSYWFCPNCYQEMPDLLTVIKNTKTIQKHHILEKCATTNEFKLTRSVNELSRFSV